jgi:hypothetical protein
MKGRINAIFRTCILQDHASSLETGGECRSLELSLGRPTPIADSIFSTSTKIHFVRIKRTWELE